MIDNDNKVESIKNLKGFNSIFSDSVVNLFSKITANVVYFLFISSIVKYFGSKKYGEFGIFLMAAQFIYIGFLVWLKSGILKFGREEFLEHKKINKIFSAHIIYAVPSILLLGLLIIFFQDKVLNYLKLNNIFIYILILYFVCNYLSELLFYSVHAVGEIKIMSIARLFEKGTPLIFLIILYFSNLPKLSLLILGIILGYLLASSFIFILCNKKIFFPFTINKETIRKYTKYSIPLFLSGIVAYLIMWLDLAILKKFFSYKIVGEFFYCQQIFNGLNQISLVLMTVVTPLTITLIYKKREDLLKKVITNISLTGMALFILGLNLLWFILCLFLPYLFNENIFQISLTLNILIFAIPLNFMLNIIGGFIAGYGLTWDFSINNIISLIIKIALSYFLIPLIGIIGGGVTTFAVVLFRVLCFFKILKRKLDFNPLNNILLMGLIMVLLVLFFLTKNIYITFIINNICIIGFIKIFKVASKKK